MTAPRYWIALAWGSVPAGPERGGPPWLFPRREDAELYARQLGHAVVAEFEPRITEWRGATLVQHPPLEPPRWDGAHASTAPPPPPSAEPEHVNGAAPHAAVPPPPTE